MVHVIFFKGWHIKIYEEKKKPNAQRIRRRIMNFNGIIRSFTWGRGFVVSVSVYVRENGTFFASVLCQTAW